MPQTRTLEAERLDRHLFAGIAHDLHGDGWVRGIAADLGALHPDGPRDPIDDRLIRRWAAGTRDVPEWVTQTLAIVLARRARDHRETADRLDAHWSEIIRSMVAGEDVAAGHPPPSGLPD